MKNYFTSPGKIFTFQIQKGILSKIFRTSGMIMILLSFFVYGCKKVVEETGKVGICPTVVSTDPTTGAINVTSNKKISIVFNEPMDPASINTATVQLKQGSNFVLGTVSYSGVTSVFTPSAPLIANTVYTGVVTTGVKDPAKNAMIADYVWTFNTGNTPVVVSTDPANGASEVILTKAISATFSTPMDPSTMVAANYFIKQGNTLVPGAITYSGSTVLFTPTSPLTANTVYTGTVTTGVKDVAGNAMAANYTWSFSTGGIPTVVSTDPANGDLNIALNKVISATFNKKMNNATLNLLTYTLKQGTTNIPGTYSFNGTTALLTPIGMLTPNTVYTATITTGAKDSAGNSIAADYIWSFTTGNAPVVVATDPANGDLNVPLSKTITASFSTAMNPATLNKNTFQVKKGATVLDGTYSYSGTTISFKPTLPLEVNTAYTAVILAGVKDLSGNSMAADYNWSFSTNSNPAVTSTDPTSNETGVIISKTIRANFSKAMDPNTINVLTFQLKQGINPISGAVTYSGTTASFIPTANLSANTLYTATITTGAKDLFGNSLAANYTWNFTTTATPPLPLADILGTAALFGAFGGNAGITNQGINTVINNGSISTTAASTLVTGFHDGTTGDVYTETPLNIGLVTGRIYTAPPFPGTASSFAIATKGLQDANAAYLAISPAGKPGGSDPGAGELGGLTLAPGIYLSAGGSFKITNGDLVLDAQGNPNAQWFFQAPTSLTVGIAGPTGARNVRLINGGLAKNVYWYVGSAATINGAGGGIMTGNIISSAGVTFSTAGNAVQTVLNGRAISLVASVTMVNTTINVPN